MKPTHGARQRDHPVSEQQMKYKWKIPVSEQQMKYKWKIQIYVETERSMSLQDVFLCGITVTNVLLVIQAYILSKLCLRCFSVNSIFFYNSCLWP